MTDRVKNTIDVIGEGNYDWQRLGSLILGLCAGVEAAAALGDALPAPIRPYIMAVRGYGAVVGIVVSTVLAKLGKPVLVTNE